MDVERRMILLVEDNEDDVFIFERAYKQAQLTHPMQVVRDGQEALARLCGEREFADRAEHPIPFLVFVDLKLPSKSGLELLRAVRAQPSLRDVCFIVLTSSAETRDVLQAQELGAQAFLVKPPTAKTIAAVVAAAEVRGDGGRPLRLEIPGNMFEAATLSALRRISSS